MINKIKKTELYWLLESHYSIKHYISINVYKYLRSKKLWDFAWKWERLTNKW